VTLDDQGLAGKLAQRVQALASPDPRIRLFWCDLSCDPALAALARDWLAPAERARAARFGTEALRQRYVTGRAILRATLGQRLHHDPPSVMIERGRRGRPQLAGSAHLDFNVSHTGDVLLIGLAENVHVGVDVERVDRIINVSGISRRCLSPAERAELRPFDEEAARQRVLRLWTCKEAMSKATGDALSAPFRELDVAFRPEPVLRAGPPPYLAAHWRLHALTVPASHFATLAVWSISVSQPG